MQIMECHLCPGSGAYKCIRCAHGGGSSSSSSTIVESDYDDDIDMLRTKSKMYDIQQEGFNLCKEKIRLQEERLSAIENTLSELVPSTNQLIEKNEVCATDDRLHSMHNRIKLLEEEIHSLRNRVKVLEEDKRIGKNLESGHVFKGPSEFIKELVYFKRAGEEIEKRHKNIEIVNDDNDSSITYRCKYNACRFSVICELNPGTNNWVITHSIVEHNCDDVPKIDIPSSSPLSVIDICDTPPIESMGSSSSSNNIEQDLTLELDKVYPNLTTFEIPADKYKPFRVCNETEQKKYKCYLSCDFMIVCNKIPGTIMWKIEQLNLNHTCVAEKNSFIQWFNSNYVEEENDGISVKTILQKYNQSVPTQKQYKHFVFIKLLKDVLPKYFRNKKNMYYIIDHRARDEPRRKKQKVTQRKSFEPVVRKDLIQYMVNTYQKSYRKSSQKIPNDYLTLRQIMEDLHRDNIMYEQESVKSCLLEYWDFKLGYRAETTVNNEKQYNCFLYWKQCDDIDVCDECNPQLLEWFISRFDQTTESDEIISMDGIWEEFKKSASAELKSKYDDQELLEYELLKEWAVQICKVGTGKNKSIKHWKKKTKKSTQ